MEQNKTFSSGKDVNGDEWYVDNYVLLKNYYDMTISRIAARCVRSGNIAIEEYKHYAYILDVLEEISETGEYILAHSNLYPYVEKKISGGINALKSSLQDYKTELEHNATPEMIKQDADEINKVKDALGQIDKSTDPTVGAGMSVDEVINKLMHGNDSANTENTPKSQLETKNMSQPKPQAQPAPAPKPQVVREQAPKPQPRASSSQQSQTSSNPASQQG